MRFLITGGAGFIGSHLAERLLDRGDNVVLLDNLSTGSMDNIRHLKSFDRMQYHLDNIENRQLVAELVDDADAVIHVAAAVGVKLIVESPVRTIETNVNGTQMILEAANKKKKLVLTASTSEVSRRTRFARRSPRLSRRPGRAAPRALTRAPASTTCEMHALPTIPPRSIPGAIARLARSTAAPTSIHSLPWIDRVVEMCSQ